MAEEEAVVEQLGEAEDKRSVDEEVLRHLLAEVQTLTDENVQLNDEMEELKAGFMKPAEVRQLERYQGLWGIIVNLIEAKDSGYVHHRLRQLVEDELYYLKRGTSEVE